MAQYTIQIREILLDLINAHGGRPSIKPNELIQQGRGYLFDFDYPIFDDSYKATLETKILKHFFVREIGLETYGLFKYKLDVLLNEIMPYYNQMYQSTMLKFNPFYNVDKKTDGHKVGTGDKNDTVHTNVDIGQHEDTTTDSWGTTAAKNEYKPNNKVSTVRNTDDTTVYGSSVEYQKGEVSTTELGHSETTKNTGYTEHETLKDDTDGKSLHSDTPQGKISNLQPVDGYLSSADITETHNKSLKKDTDNTSSVKSLSGNDVVTLSGKNTDTKLGDDKVEHRGKDDVITTGDDVTYTTSVTHDNSDTDRDLKSNQVTNSNADSNFTNIDDYSEHVFGKSEGETFSEMLLKFRDTFVNIDMDVIDELEVLFMQIF